MPCDDCKGLQREINRLRVFVEQNFTAMLKRFDHQDKNLLLMMELLSEQYCVEGSPEFSASTPSSDYDCQKSNGIGIGGACRRKAPPSPKKRRLAAVTLSHYPRKCQTNEFQSLTSEIPNATAAEEERNDNCFVDYFMEGTNYADQNHTAAGRCYEGDNNRNPEETSVASDGAVVGVASSENCTNYEDNEMTNERYPTGLACRSHVRRDVANADDHSGPSTAVNYLEGATTQFDDDDVNADDSPMVCNDDAIQASASSSGTACVTVRSAIRMEDLDREIATTSNSLGQRPALSRQTTAAKLTAKALKEGQRFETMEDFLACLCQYEHTSGIALIVHDSKKVETANKKLKPGSLTWDTKFKYVYFELRCSRAGVGDHCPFRLLVINSKSERRLVVTKLVESHHELCFSHNHDEASRLRLLKRLL